MQAGVLWVSVTSWFQGFLHLRLCTWNKTASKWNEDRWRSQAPKHHGDIIIIAKSCCIELGEARLLFCSGGMWQCEGGKYIKPRKGCHALTIPLGTLRLRHRSKQSWTFRRTSLNCFPISGKSWHHYKLGLILSLNGCGHAWLAWVGTGKWDWVELLLN